MSHMPDRCESCGTPCGVLVQVGLAMFGQTTEAWICRSCRKAPRTGKEAPRGADAGGPRGRRERAAVRR